jgi:hypothetical protein
MPTNFVNFMNRTSRLLGVAVGLLVTVLAQQSRALVVPFTEDFISGNSNWLDGSSASATWVSSDGVEGGGYITANATVVPTGGFGAIAFRGNAVSDASGDAFVGNWLTGGVATFSTYVRHNAPAELNFFARLDAGSGRAGSSVNFAVSPNTWTHLSVPIVDSTSSFQSYGAGTFSTVFNNILNIQIVLAPNDAMAGQTYSIDVDQISIVPEPSTWALVVFGFVLLGVFGNRRAKKI